MTEHRIKTWPEHFAAVREGLKTAEYRRLDRGYKVGDTLVLEEWVPEQYDTAWDKAAKERTYTITPGHYTGESERVTVTCIVTGPPIPEGYGMLSFRREREGGDVSDARALAEQAFADVVAHTERLEQAVSGWLARADALERQMCALRERYDTLSSLTSEEATDE